MFLPELGSGSCSLQPCRAAFLLLVLLPQCLFWARAHHHQAGIFLASGLALWLSHEECYGSPVSHQQPRVAFPLNMARKELAEHSCAGGGDEDGWVVPWDLLWENHSAKTVSQRGYTNLVLLWNELVLPLCHPPQQLQAPTYGPPCGTMPCHCLPGFMLVG